MICFSFIFIGSRVDKLAETKTEIGMARAFVRLSLEKKLLADHLRQLLSEAALLRTLYKKHAFLCHEEEREQFIYHLQSLNVVDYFCFTDHFKSIRKLCVRSTRIFQLIWFSSLEYSHRLFCPNRTQQEIQLAAYIRKCLYQTVRIVGWIR